MMHYYLNTEYFGHFLLAIGVTPVFIGSVIYATNRREESNIFYFLLTLAISFWVCTLAFFEILPNLSHALAFLNLYFISADAIVLALLYFALSFGRREKFSIFWAVLLAIPGLVYDLIGLLQGGIFTIVPTETATFGRVFTFQPIYYLMLATVVAYCGSSVFILYRRSFGSAGIFRYKETKLLTIILIASIIGIVANLIMPIFGHDEFFVIGPVGVIGGVFYLGYMIASYQLLDLRLFVTKIFSLLIVFLLGLSIFFSENLQEYILKVAFFLLGSSASYFLWRSVKNETDSEIKVENLLKELTRQHEELEALNRRTSAFVNTTANQLRDPLSGIRWHASSLLQGSFGSLPEQSREYVNRIFESSKRLIVIVDDFLDLRKIEQGSMKYTFATFDMKVALEEVVEEVTRLAEEKGLKIVYSCDEDEYSLWGDQGKLRQVVSNLIDNAIKYTDKGEIQVRLKRREDTILISVSDHGIGLTAEQINTLFQKFSRTKEAKRVNTGGSGLGLYIAAEIVRAHRGNIWVSSEGLGRGSTFFLELPLSKDTKTVGNVSKEVGDRILTHKKALTQISRKN